MTQAECIASGKFRQNTLCVPACTANYFTTSDGSTNSSKVCYQECPFWLGYAAPTDGSQTCVKCTTGAYGSISGCFAGCQAS